MSSNQLDRLWTRDSQTANGAYTAKIAKSKMQQLSVALDIGKPLKRFLSQLLHKCVPRIALYHRFTRLDSSASFGWKRIEVELPPSGQAETTTCRISKPVPLSSERLKHLQVGFRLAGRPPPDETIHIGISYGKKSQTIAFSQGHDSAPDPLGTSDIPSVYIAPFIGFYSHLKPGMSIHSSMVIAHWSLNAAFDHPQAVVEWKRGA